MINIIYIENLVYGNSLGAGLLADVAYPDVGGPHPVIISVHGGRWIRGTRYDNGSIDVRQWAEFGFFAITIDYRLVTCSPAPACYQDMQCAIRWVHAHANQYNLDTSKIFLIGMSAGGHMVSLAATLGEGNYLRVGGWEDQSCDFAGAISSSGAYELKSLDWGSGWAPPGEAWDAAREYASPIVHISAASKPLLLLHSDDDRSVPVKQALDMAEALERAHARFRLVHFTDRGHIAVKGDIVDKVREFIEEVIRNEI